MGTLMRRISRPGIILLVTGIVLFSMSVKDTIISFKSSKSFEDVLDGQVAAGDRVQGRVPYLLDAFATEQTWTENRSNHSVTPKKNSHYYYVLPSGDAYMGLTVGTNLASQARDLTDQTYGYLAGGAAPSADLVMDTRITEMKGDLKEMFEEELAEHYGFPDSEIRQMTLLMAEPRAFTTIRVFCGVGAGLVLLGILLLIRRFRKFR